MPKYIYRATERDLIDDETGEVLATEPLAEGYAEAQAKVEAVAKAYAKSAPLFKTPWNHDRDAVSLATSTTFPEKGKTQQNQKEDADINTIVNRFLKTGQLPQMNNPPSYADLQEIDFQDAMDQVNLARRSFEALPANVRNAFQGDPARFLAYIDHCVQSGDLAPLQELNLAEIKVDEPAFEERLAKAIEKAYKPPSPPGGDLQPPKGGKGASDAPIT